MRRFHEARTGGPNSGEELTGAIRLRWLCQSSIDNVKGDLHMPTLQEFVPGTAPPDTPTAGLAGRATRTARTYNQLHAPRKYEAGRRRFSVYWTWSYPW